MVFLVLGSIREENGIRWHVCPYCSKEFKKPSDLVRHIRIHTHEKPFKCPQCFRAFAVKSTLTAHIKTHTGIKAFKCQFCMKSFSTSGSLKVHIRLHTGKALKWLCYSMMWVGPWMRKDCETCKFLDTCNVSSVIVNSYQRMYLFSVVHDECHFLS